MVWTPQDERPFPATQNGFAENSRGCLRTPVPIHGSEKKWEDTMKKLTALVLAAAVAVISFSACSSSQNTTTTSGSKAVITACVGSEPKSIDPAINQTVDGSTYLHNMFEGLTKYDKTGTKMVAGIAKSWDISSDGLTYTFHLRTDAKWSDGKPVTAADFVYAWQRAVDPKTASPYAYQLYYIKNAEAINEQSVDSNDKPIKVKLDASGKPVTDASGNYTPDASGQYASQNADGSATWINDLGVKATDDHTLVVTLEAPCAYFLQIAGFPTLFPVRKDIVEAHPDTWATDPSTYVSDGPYVLKSWKHNSEMDLEENPYYYDKADIVGAPIHFLLMDDTNAIVAAFKNGSIQLSDDYLPDQLSSMVASNQAKIYPNLAFYYYAFNDKIAPFNNVKVREALTLAVDRNYIVKNITKGGQKPAGAIVPPGILDADGKTDFRTKGGDYFDPAASAVKANITKAKQLLAEAGYPNGQGLPTITIKYNTQALHQQVAEYIQNQWKTNLGVNAQVSGEEFSVFVADRNKGNFQVARDGWSADYSDPMTFLDMFTTTSGNNDSHYSNPAYDKLIADAKQSGDQTKRMNDMHQAEKILMNDYAAMPIYYYTDPDLVSPKLQGYISTPMADKLFMWASLKK